MFFEFKHHLCSHLWNLMHSSRSVVTFWFWCVITPLCVLRMSIVQKKLLCSCRFKSTLGWCTVKSLNTSRMHLKTFLKLTITVKFLKSSNLNNSLSTCCKNIQWESSLYTPLAIYQMNPVFESLRGNKKEICRFQTSRCVKFNQLSLWFRSWSDLLSLV